MRRYALQILQRDSAAAEDIVEEVLIKIWERADHFSTFSEVKGFLYASVRNGCLNILRSRQREQVRAETFLRLHETGAVNCTDAEIVYSETLAHIRQSIDALPDKMREVF